jgi:transposase
LTARAPRIDCPECGVHIIEKLPWARRESGFTLLFEALIMLLAKSMPVSSIASYVGEHDTRIWRIIHHYVDRALLEADYSDVKHVGVDETSSKRGHEYVTVFVDVDKPRVLFVTEGKDATTVESFRKDLIAHNGDPESVTEFCSDMSLSFIKGVADSFPNAHLTFDKFHIMQVVNKAVDEVRRQEQQDCPDLKRTRYIWLKNRSNLKKSQLDKLDQLQMSKLNLKTVRAYKLKLAFQDFFNQPVETAESFLKEWYYWATHSGLAPMRDAAYTIRRHWDGILRWFKSRMTNGILEGTNSLIQAAKARARGYRKTRYLTAIIYLLGGKLDFKLPRITH